MWVPPNHPKFKTINFKWYTHFRKPPYFRIHENSQDVSQRVNVSQSKPSTYAICRIECGWTMVKPLQCVYIYSIWSLIWSVMAISTWCTTWWHHIENDKHCHKNSIEPCKKYRPQIQRMGQKPWYPSVHLKISWDVFIIIYLYLSSQGILKSSKVS